MGIGGSKMLTSVFPFARSSKLQRKRAANCMMKIGKRHIKWRLWKMVGRWMNMDKNKKVKIPSSSPLLFASSILGKSADE
jgi:hypothetical protein